MFLLVLSIQIYRYTSGKFPGQIIIWPSLIGSKNHTTVNILLQVDKLAVGKVAPCKFQPVKKTCFIFITKIKNRTNISGTLLFYVELMQIRIWQVLRNLSEEKKQSEKFSDILSQHGFRETYCYLLYNKQKAKNFNLTHLPYRNSLQCSS